MSAPSATPGRVIRAALIILPFGTIVLGALSFVFYFNKQEKTLQRSIKYAAGLQKDLNAADLQRSMTIVAEALAKPEAERAKTLASFIESSLGPENMGYEVRTIVDRKQPDAPALAMDVELTGTKRAYDVVLVLTNYLSADEGKSVAAMLATAHSMTGLPKLRTIRFAAIQNVAVLKSYQSDAVSAQDRITHVLLLGDAAKVPDSDITGPLHLERSGAVLLRPDLQGDPLTAAQSLMKQVSDLADRL